MTCPRPSVAVHIWPGLPPHCVPVVVAGQEYPDWVNAVHKPLAILTALAAIKTPYVLYADSRDAILAGDPELLVDRLEAEFEAGLIFGACQLSWPNAAELSGFELSLPEAAGSDYKHLNGGLWIGRTDLAQEFYASVRDEAPHPAAPESEQGKLRALFPQFYPRVALDYQLRMFHNVGFLFQDPYEVVNDK